MLKLEEELDSQQQKELPSVVSEVEVITSPVTRHCDPDTRHCDQDGGSEFVTICYDDLKQELASGGNFFCGELQLIGVCRAPNLRQGDEQAQTFSGENVFSRPCSISGPIDDDALDEDLTRAVPKKEKKRCSESQRTKPHPTPSRTGFIKSGKGKEAA